MHTAVLLVGLLWTAQVPPAPDYATLYDQGVSFAAFLEQAKARREEWRTRYRDAVASADLITQMRALPERRRLLVVALDRCNDSANTIPYLARLVDASPERLEMRVVNSTIGRAVMEAHRTPDGRAATPTVVVLSEDGRLLGAWTERPSTLQTWVLEQLKIDPQADVHDHINAWYAQDAGKATMAEIAAIVAR